LVANVVAGQIWTGIAPAAACVYGAVLSVVATLALLTLVPLVGENAPSAAASTRWRVSTKLPSADQYVYIENQVHYDQEQRHAEGCENPRTETRPEGKGSAQGEDGESNEETE